MNEMMMLVVGLVNLEINFTFEIDERLGYDGAHVTFEKDGEHFSVIWNYCSYGYKEGLLEAWTKGGKTFNEPVGWLTAVDILKELQGGK